MLKKKNIAMVMAAATVATSVAPVFASSTDVQKVDEATMIAKVQELLNTKYSDATETGGEGLIQSGQEYKNSVYKIMNGGTRITNISVLKDEIEKAKVAGQDLTLEVTDKGHKNVDGRIVATELTKYSYYTDVNAQLDSGKLALVGATVAAGASTTQATIQLLNGTEIDLIAGDYVLDLDKPVDASGNVIDPAKINSDQAVQRKVVGFKLAEGTEAVKDIESKRVMDLTITSKVEVELNLSDLYTSETKYTKKGAELVNLVTQEAVKVGNAGRVVKDGVQYQIETFDKESANELSNIKATKDGYELTINLEVRKMNATIDSNPSTKNVSIVINSTSQAELAKVRDDIYSLTKVVAGNYTELSGDDRFKTAVSVSEETYASVDENTATTNRVPAGAIVLVGEDAIVDGLAAAPLAAQENAPILLTKKDAVQADTLNEIKRIAQKGVKVYLVGGESNISKSVENQLISEMNAQIVRLAGDDRYETSLAVAEELRSSNRDNAFVVGGDGLADAMSIAAIAANSTNIRPIIVSPVDGLTKDAKAFLKANPGTVNVVGGEARVSTQVLKDINAQAGNTATRIAGETRNETNAKVIDAFGGSNLENVYVSKDGDKQLVDALAAAPLAGRNNGVIVLATNDLTKEQSTAIENELKQTLPTYKLTQVGGGVGTTVIGKLLTLLGL